MATSVMNEHANELGIVLKQQILDDPSSTYTLKINGEMPSKYRALLNEGKGDSVSVRSVTTTAQPFIVTAVTPIDQSAIRVDYNQEVDPVSSLMAVNYNLSTANGIPVSVQEVLPYYSGKGKSVLIRTIGVMDASSNYTISIKNVKNTYNTETIADKSYSFNGKTFAQINTLRVLNVMALDNSSLLIYFSGPIDNKSIPTPGNFTAINVTDGGYPLQADTVYFNPLEPYKLKLFFAPGSELPAGKSYRLHLPASLRDETGSYVDLSSEFSFTGSGITTVKPLLTEAKIVGNSIVKVQTQKELQPAGANINPANYVLESVIGTNTSITKRPTEAFLVDGATLILVFDQLNIQDNYVLSFQTLTDYSGNYVRTSADDSHTVKVKNGIN